MQHTKGIARTDRGPIERVDRTLIVTAGSVDRTVELGQYPTPAWAASALVRHHLSDLTRNDVVCDPTCGPGRFLQAIPEHVPAFGAEIDPRLAQQAHDLTGRPILVGDFLKLELPERPTVFVGNPPFKMRLVDKILERAHELLPNDGRVGLILPCYAFQTDARVVRYSESWSLSQEFIPRNIYPGLSKPLMFAMFRKDQRRLMVGFSLYHESVYVKGLPEAQREAMISGPATWRSLVEKFVEMQGGEAKLEAIYEYISTRRPSRNPHWKPQVRKVCQTHLHRTGRGRYATTAKQAALF